jgi:pimeloyl-ACP methyl ester carboxylesterase
LLAACTVGDVFRDGRARADHVALQNGFEKRLYDAPPFTLVGFRRDDGPAGGSLSVYIEGDGLAWLSRDVQSDDPTPVDPTVFRIAVQDPAAKRLYLGRPCQYLTTAALARCAPAYWSVRRFAPEVIAALGRTIDVEKAAMQADSVLLYGWSGGGVAAALVAAARGDVLRLVTAAAPLDHSVWTRLTQVTPLAGSLNPADQARRLAEIPQVNFVGLDDDVVPPAVADAYAARMTDRSRVKIVPLANFGHRCCWVEQWPALLGRLN